MKKDYIDVSTDQASIDEDAFVEDFWTQRWNQVTQLPGAEGLSHSEQYQVMRPFLLELPSGSHILDGGCGMGEWTVFFTQQGFHVIGLDVSQSTITRLQGLLPGN